MKTFCVMLKRNIKMFFKDKGLFFTSMITPLILLVLYATFLSNVYKDSFMGVLEEAGVTVDDRLMNGLVGGQLFSSLLAVSCVTVSFCSNMLMVQDKVSGARKDFLMGPIKKSTLAFSYYTASAFSTLIICMLAMVACFIYIAIIGWYITVADVFCIILDVFLLVMFGTALSSVINYFLSSQGHISAVGSIVSSCYGFICGAYMPLASFADGLRNVVMFLPGTYGTSLLRNHTLNGVFAEMSSQLSASNYPAVDEVVKGLRDSVDCNIYFFDGQVEVGTMYLVLSVAVVALVATYVVINILSKKKN
ncbi:MAG: ABC transporter permease [Clostridiales bacterium]|nr:ABC transporter permease [Clostridiales bacterium]